MEPRLLTFEEARALAGGDPRRFGVWPLPFRPRRWDRVDILDAMRAHREAAEEAERWAALGVPLGLQPAPQRERRTVADNAVNAAPRILNARVRAAIHKCLRRRLTPSSWMEIVGYTLDELRAHLEAQFADGMGWHNMGAWHIDHKRPLSSFSIAGADCPEFRAAWALENLQPLWAEDNLRKGARWNP